MNRIITKFVVASQKNHKMFENRICDIIAAGVSGEEALEGLILGTPKDVTVLDEKALMRAIAPNCSKIKEVTLYNMKLRVRYERVVTRWFTTQEEADKATSYYAGSDRKSEKYQFCKDITDENNDTTLGLGELEEKGIISVVRQ